MKEKIDQLDFIKILKTSARDTVQRKKWPQIGDNLCKTHTC